MNAMNVCEECEQSLGGRPVAVVDGMLLHNDKCAAAYRGRRERVLQRLNGVRMVETWTAAQRQDERGVVYHERGCKCPPCREWSDYDEAPPVDGEEVLEGL